MNKLSIKKSKVDFVASQDMSRHKCKNIWSQMKDQLIIFIWRSVLWYFFSFNQGFLNQKSRRVPILYPFPTHPPQFFLEQLWYSFKVYLFAAYI